MDAKLRIISSGPIWYSYRFRRCSRCYTPMGLSFRDDLYVCSLCGHKTAYEWLADRSKLRVFLDKITGMHF